ncbi:hypothetical protein ABGB18_44185 [Nonomuraea sp. B12E4]|uniref:hypothetical protein n=1 Tax=Nonomuraea sp. B12E4 TaxID=3153564 RepID=UPI00325F8719
MAFLDLAAALLQRDLDRCVKSPGGRLRVGGRRGAQPYLAGGGTGIAYVLADLLLHRPDERLAEARRDFFETVTMNGQRQYILAVIEHATRASACSALPRT